MKWLGSLTVGLALSILAVSSLEAQSASSPLVRQLEGAKDYRARVQAALSLGTLKASEAREALERALGQDPQVAVRAAAAVALGTLGDVRALAALERQASHRSLAVRQRVEQAVRLLREGAAGAAGDPNVLVELGSLNSRGRDVSPALVKTLQRASRDGIGALAGVRMVDGKAIKGDRKVPLVRVTGSLKAVETSESDGKLVCAARVEYVLHRMPGQVIAAIVSGSAKTTVAADVLNNREALDKLRRQAVEAAVASALRRAPEALLKVAAQ